MRPSILARWKLAACGLGLLGGLGLGLVGSSCLPGDDRPTPGVVDFTVEPSQAITEGVTTADGWTLSFERLLIGLGGATIRDPIRDTVDASTCNNYSGRGYDRLIEATVPGPQKLSQVYGLGTCALRFRTGTPASNALLGEQVSADDLDHMHELGSDAYASLEGTSVYLRGTAKRGEVTKRFEWHFREGYSFHDCGADGGAAASDAGDSVTIAIHGGDTIAMPIAVHGEELFRASAEEGAALRFDLLAAADLDEDQTITLEELGKLPGPLPADAGAADAGDAGPPTLEDFVYRTLLPRIVRLESLGQCTADLRSPSL